MPLVRPSLVLLLAGLAASAACGQAPAATDTESAVPDTLIQRVSGAFQTGNAQRLLTPAATRVEVSLFGTRTFYSSAQAFYVLRDFFTAHPPASFSVADTTGTGTSCFLQGQFEHTRGERILQVFVRLVRHEETAWRLHEVRIASGAE